MRKFIKKAVAIALSAITAMSTFAVCTTGASAAVDDGNVSANDLKINVRCASDKYKFISEGDYYGNVYTSYTTGYTDYYNKVYCLNPTLNSPVDNGSVRTYTDSEIATVGNVKLKKVLYYGYGGPGWDDTMRQIVKDGRQGGIFPELPDCDDMNGDEWATYCYAVTHIACGIAYNANLGFVHYAYNDSLYKVAKTLYDEAQSRDFSDDWMVAYYLNEKRGSYQDLVAACFACRLELQKSSTSSQTDGNANYSLAGAKYAVFDNYDKAKKAANAKTEAERREAFYNGNSLAGWITTDAGGYGAYTDSNGYNIYLARDGYSRYYAVEYTAPKGYQLSRDIVEFKFNRYGTNGNPVMRASCKDEPDWIVLDLQKSSANPSLSDGNSCYSLAGAEYGVYNDISKAKKDAKGETKSERWANSLPGYIKTDENGYGQYSFGNPYFKVPIGTYYALEATAPKGYRLSNDIVEFKNSGKKTSDGYAIYRAVCSDIPESDPVVLMLKKQSATGLQAESGDLEGAEFEVSYYDVDPNVVTSLEELQKTGKTPLKTWRFKTDEKGRLRYLDSYKVSGPALYYHNSGRPSIPTGALTFKEVKAPTSGKYLINEDTFFAAIASEGNTDVEVNLDIIVPEVPATAGLTIQKSSEDGIVEGLWFRIEGTNGYTNDFATNALGTISVEGLDVYDGNGKKISYTITELGFKNSDGKYTLPKRYKATEPKTVTLDETKNVVVRFENKVINGGINIVKTSDDGKVENIYFEIKGSNGIVRNVVTDKNGKVSISALPVYDNDNNVVSYTIKELGIKNGDGTYSIPKKYIVPKPQTVMLDSGTQDLGLVKTINVQNKIVKGSLEINKTSTDGKIKGVWFNITSANGFDENYATDKNGNITITDLDVYDDTDKKIEYTIKELGIKDASGKIIFPAYYFDVDDVQVTLEENTTTTAPTFENKNKLGQIRITKQGMDGEVNGFTFRVSSVTDGYTYNEIFTQKSISGIRVRNLQPFLADGTPIEYKIEEVGFRYPSKTYADNEYDPLPARYIKVADEYVQWATEADLSDTNISTKYITLRNFLKRGNLEIIKESEDGKVEGIWFEVKDAAYENAESYKACTDATGRVRFEGLDVYRGNNDLVEYTITELGEKQADGTYKNPFKYNTPPTQTVTINYDETAQAGFASATFKNTLKTGSISIEKVDIGGKGVDGARFVVTKKSDNAVVGKITTDANGKGSITGLAQGDYRIVEERTKGGFNLLKSYKDVSITGDNEQTLNYTYHVRETLLPELPLTGGDNLTLGMMGIGSLIFAVGVIICAKHYKKSKRLGNA